MARQAPRGFRHLLVATDGSQRSLRAAKIASATARELRARITALYVVAEGVPSLFSGERLYGSGVVGARIRTKIRREAGKALDAVRCEARARGVRCAGLRAMARAPWRKILATARARHCDLIVMGSHGRGALAGAVLGSQTAKVLSHGRIPVLVCR
jgi:nucleotide-binding universal stress UspA family protein